MTTRRQFLEGAGALAALSAIQLRPAQATPAAMQAAIDAVTGGAVLRPGRVKLDIPPLVENGNSIQCTVSVPGPTSASERVRALHVFNERNPQPNMFGVRFGPRAGPAKFTTRIRLAGTQTLVAVAELADGSFWVDRVEVVVTLAACVEDP